MMHIKPGTRFGRITITRELQRHTQPCGESRRVFEGVCDCGTIKKYSIYDLTSGHTKSCGCYREQRRSESHFKHGLCHSKIYSVWEGIKSRCDNPKERNYKNYGGRGITYDKKRKTFEGFYEDMKDSFLDHVTKNGEADTSIDRIDTNGNYCKENCRRATDYIQANNTRACKYNIFQGEKMTQAQIASKLRVRPANIKSYLDMFGSLNGIEEYSKKWKTYKGKYLLPGSTTHDGKMTKD